MSADVIKEFFAVLGIDVDDKSMREAESAIGRVRSLARGAAFAFAGMSAAAIGIIHSTSEAGREALNWAAKIGITVQELTQLDAVSERLTGNVEAVREGLTDLAEKASDVFRNDPKGTSDAAESFKALGVSVRNASGNLKPTLDLFEEVADKVQKMKHRGDATGVSMRLFGDDVGRKLAPMLMLGSQAIREMRAEAEVMGETFSTRQAGAAAAMAREIAGLRRQAMGYVYAVGFSLAPAVIRIAQATRSWMSANRDVIVQNVTAFFETFLEVLRYVGIGLAHVFKGVTFLIRLFGGMRNVLMILGAAFGVVFAGALGMAITKVAALGGAMKLLSWATLRAAASSVLLGIQYLAAAAFLALVFDEIRTTFEGGDSLISRLNKALWSILDAPPNANDHWLVKTLRFIDNAILQTIQTVDRFFAWVGGQKGGNLAKNDAFNRIGPSYISRRTNPVENMLAPAGAGAAGGTSTAGATPAIIVQQMTVNANSPEDLALQTQRKSQLAAGAGKRIR